MAIKRSADVPASPPRPRTAKRILTTESPPPYLPSELIFTILSWLPSNSVLRFRSVCKAWQAMLSDPSFITAHLERSKTIRPSLLMVPCAYDPNDIQKNNDDSALDMSFYRYRAGGAEEPVLLHREELPRGIALWSSPLHCDGLILVSTMREEELAVCNPATREFVALPERKHCTYAFPRAGLGFDPRSKRYKVARFFYECLANSDGDGDGDGDGDSDGDGDGDGDGLACRFEVLTLGADSAWRQTADPPYWICGRTPAHVNGYIYWTCVGPPSRPDPPGLFVRFSLADEEFGLVPHPPSRFRPARLAELGGELCCVCFGYINQELELWSLSFDGGVDNGKPEWSRRWATVIGPDLVTELAECRAVRPPRVVLHEGAWLLTEERNVHRYDESTGEIIEKIFSGIQDTRYHYPRRHKEVVLHLTNYVESLVRIN